MSIEEALNQIKQRIMMHELEQTTSVENEREKVILNYINKLQDKINKAIEIIEKHKDYEDEGLLVDETIKLLDILQDKEEIE